jgi:hypothetical protein
MRRSPTPPGSFAKTDGGEAQWQRRENCHFKRTALNRLDRNYPWRDRPVSQESPAFMTRLAIVITGRSNLSRTGAALLFASLGVACDGTNGAAATGDGSSTDGSAGNTFPADGAGSTDGSAANMFPAGSTDGSAANTVPADGAGLTDGPGVVNGAGSVNLGSAASFAVLAKSGISTVPTSAITGNVGVSPAAASYITGFSLSEDPSNTFSTSKQITGEAFASDYAQPTPSNLTTAIGDMQLAFTSAAGRAPTVTELGAGSIGGMTLTAGVYKWGTGLGIPTGITLTGSATDVWIFQIAQGLTVSSAAVVSLAGGAGAKNVFWQVAGAVQLGTTAHLVGTVMSKTSIALMTGASIEGRLFAQTAVTLAGSTVIQPSP